MKGAKRSGCRHIAIRDIKVGGPFVTTIREPVRHAYSWYQYLRGMKDLKVFSRDGSRILSFKQWLNRPFHGLTNAPKQRLSIYDAYQVRPIRYHVFEHGVDAIFPLLGYPELRADHIGKTVDDEPFFEIEIQHLVMRFFPADWKLYLRYGV